MLDNETLEEFFEHLADRYTGAEIVDLLEDAGIITVYDVLNFLEEFIVEGKNFLNPEKKENYSPKELGIYHLADDIDFKSAKEVIEFILSHDTRDKDKLDFLTLIITSYGGLVDGAFAITDIIAGSSIPVHTVGLGVIASAGLMIFMAGAKGHRTLTPNTAILSHQYSGWVGGKEHELIASRKQQDLISERIVNHYRRHTGMREEQIKKLLLPEKDVWLSAKEALSYKLCDKVSTI